MRMPRNRTTLLAKRRTRLRSGAPLSLAATPDKMLPFARALAADAAAVLRRSLGQPVTEDSLLGATRASHQFYEQTWSYIQSLHVVPHACQSGCAHCCYLTVEASGPEVLLIARHLQATTSPEQLAVLNVRLRQTAATVQGMTPTERVRASVPCALLQNGHCSVYAVRPLGCRSWNSRDASACARVLQEGGGDLRPVQDQRPGGIELGIRTGLAEALSQTPLPEDPNHPCELNTGLMIALDEPQAMEHWLGGADILAPARSAVRYDNIPSAGENPVK